MVMGEPGSKSGARPGTKEAACGSANCLKYTLCIYNFIFLVIVMPLISAQIFLNR